MSRIAAMIVVDLERSALNLPARAAQPFLDTSVLARTLRQCRLIPDLDDIILFCPASQLAAVQKLTTEHAPLIIPLTDPIPVSSHLRRRKWSLNSWRGGLRDATIYDEIPLAPAMIPALRSRHIDSVLLVAPHAVALDPDLTSRILRQHRRTGPELRVTFSQAAPGLVPAACLVDLLHDMITTGFRLGDTLAYDPDNPHADYITQPCCVEMPPHVRRAEKRFLADTHRSFTWLHQHLQNDPHLTGSDLARLAYEQPDTEPFPRELEIEITTAPTLRLARDIFAPPHHQRPDMSLDTFTRIVKQTVPFDDLCLTLAGFGDPLAHPHLIDMIHAAHHAGIFGLHLETDGRLLHDSLARQLAESPLDIISVHLDADSPAAYTALKHESAFDDVTANIDNFLALTHNCPSAPLLVPHLSKTNDTLAAMEPFYDRWLRTAPDAVINGFNDYAAQTADLAVMDMTLPRRFPCRRLRRILTVLADGSVLRCAQDAFAEHPLGSVSAAGLLDLWNHDQLQQLRRAHRNHQFDTFLCPKCKEWCR